MSTPAKNLTYQNSTFSSVDDFVVRCGLKAKKSGGKYMISCPNPGHPDQNPSCAVSEYNGWISLKCFSLGCSTESMLVGLNLERSDLCLNPTTITTPRLEPLTKPKPQAPSPDPQPKAPRVTFCNLADYAERSTPQPIELEAYTKAGWRDVVYRDKKCVAIPLSSGETKYRNLESEGSKYFNPTGKGKGRGWYGLKRAALRAKATGVAIQANGEASVVVAQYFGIPAFCSMAGEGTPPTPEMLDQVRESGITRVILAPDADQPGHDGATRTADVYRQAGFTVDIRDFGSDRPTGFDLRDFCSVHREKSFEELQKLPELQGPQPTPQVIRHWMDADQVKFTSSYLSQLGFSPKSKNTVLLILALLNGRTSAPISNFLLGYHAGRIESGDFENLDLAPEYPAHVETKSKIADRGRKMWKALDKDQAKIGVVVIERQAGGRSENGFNESSTYTLSFGHQMGQIIDDLRSQKLGVRMTSQAINRQARALADSQLAAVIKPDQDQDDSHTKEEETETDHDQKKIVDFCRWLDNRKAKLSKEVRIALAGTFGMILLDPEDEPDQPHEITEMAPYIREGEYSSYHVEDGDLIDPELRTGLVTDFDSDFVEFRAENQTTNVDFETVENQGGGTAKLAPLTQPEITYHQQDDLSNFSAFSEDFGDDGLVPVPTVDPLTQLETDLDIPPETFRNELTFIGDEPPETRRAIARERYQQLQSQLEKYAPNFGFPELRQRFKELFGDAVRGLLESVSPPEPIGRQLRLVGQGGDL